jgi:hypothetical protein
MQSVDWELQVYPTLQQSPAMKPLHVGPRPQNSAQTGRPFAEVQGAPTSQQPPLPSVQAVWPAAQVK